MDRRVLAKHFQCKVNLSGIQRDPIQRGVIPRAITEIFEIITNSPDGVEFIVKMSVVEVYKEQIRDLLELKSEERIEIREDVHGVTYLDGVEESYVGNELEVSEMMMNALANRRVGRTNMNEVSSRSHVVTIFHIEQNIKAQSKILKGKLFLVDLAGSECLTKTGATGERMEEAKHINKGLLTIGRVINALTEGAPFIPYRDSKLTRILKESLGGNAKTTLIITASPSIYNETETLSTLRFGVRAKLIKNRPVVNLELSKEQLIKMIDLKNDRITYLEAYLGFLENYVIAILKQQLPKFVMNTPWKYDLFTPAKSQIKPDPKQEGSLPTGSQNQNQNDTSFQSGSLNVPVEFNPNSTFTSKQSDLNDTQTRTSEKLYNDNFPQSSELTDRISELEEKIRQIEENEVSMRQKVEELTNKNSSLETKIKIQKEQGNISNSKIVTLVQTLKMIEEEYKLVDEKNMELENQNSELMNMVDELEAKLTQSNSTAFSILPLLENQKTSNSALEQLVKNPVLSSNTNVNSQELTQLIEFAKATSTENELIKKKNGELQSMVRELTNSYKTLIEKEIPELDSEHKNVIANFKRIEAKNDFVFNDKIMSIINDYLFKNDNLEADVKLKNSQIESLKIDFSKLKKEYHDKITASQKKMKVLVKCIDSLSKYTEEIMLNNATQSNNKLEVNLNQNDLFSSAIQGTNLQKSMYDIGKSKIIKVIKGENSKKSK